MSKRELRHKYVDDNLTSSNDIVVEKSPMIGRLTRTRYPSISMKKEKRVSQNLALHRDTLSQEEQTSRNTEKAYIQTD